MSEQRELLRLYWRKEGVYASYYTHAQIDLSASYVIGKAITLTFAATNLGNERYNRFFDNDKSQIASTSYTGRQFFFGVRGDF